MVPVPMPNAGAQHNAFAGTDAQRADDLQAAINNPAIAAIHCLRGGYGLSRYLDELNFAPLRTQPKWLIGFSDVTALLLALDAHGLASLHGPMAAQLAGAEASFNAANLLPWLLGQPHTITWADAAAAAHPARTLVCDTDALTTATYAQLYLGYVPEVLQQLAALRTYHHTLLCLPDLPWQPDGIRLFGSQRQAHFELLVKGLQTLNRSYSLVSGLGEARLASALFQLKTIN